MTLTRLTLIPARKADFLFAPVSSIWRPKVVFLMTICKITMTAIQISVQIGKPSRFPCPSCLNQSISAGRSMRMISLPAQYHAGLNRSIAGHFGLRTVQTVRAADVPAQQP